MLCAILALASVSLVLDTAASATAPSRTAQLQAAVDNAVATGVPGVILMARDGNGTIRVTGGYGTLTSKTPIRATDRFRIGSLTKTFVATVALQLVDEGALSLDDSVERWLPGVVPNGSNISVRELLSMRSGLYDYLNENTVIVKRFLAGDLLHRYTPLELVRIATAHKPYFAPGAGWHYCNTCYILVGLIVEKVTGHPIATEVEQRIFNGNRQVVLFVNLDEDNHTATVLKALNGVMTLAVCGKR